MLKTSGDWVVPTLQGQPYLDKPPLLYWLIAASYALFGVSDSVARLAPTVAIHLSILATFFFGQTLARQPGGLGRGDAADRVARSFWGWASSLILDGLLCLCVTRSA